MTIPRPTGSRVDGRRNAGRSGFCHCGTISLQEMFMDRILNRKTVARFAAIVGLPFLLAGAALGQHYTRTDLATNSASVSSAPNVDTNLVNPWGLSRATGSPWWVSDNGTGLSTLYDGSGAIQGLVVSIPRAKGGKGLSSPT